MKKLLILGNALLSLNSKVKRGVIMKTIKFGNYWQTNDKTKEIIEWKVLDIKNGKALLISKYALDCRQYHENSCNITWEECT